jgi:endogenous inhibitor of DNA gyrase (YacG/DUF329 family)
LIDFGRWADETYSVPGQSINPSDLTEQSQDSEANDENN